MRSDNSGHGVQLNVAVQTAWYRKELQSEVQRNSQIARMCKRVVS